ncbi:hypothetical protein LPJ81_004832, partial [Coemansia sp. IMI 209127]
IRDVQIWTDMRGNVDWEGVALEKLKGDAAHIADGEMALLDQTQLPHGHSVMCFGLSVPSTAPAARRFEFTVRWRKAGQKDWQWAGKWGQNARVVVYDDAPELSRQPALGYWRQQLRQLLLKDDDTEQPLAPIADSWQTSSKSASCLFKPLVNALPGGKLAFARLSTVERYLGFVRKDKFWIVPRSGSGPLKLNGFDIFILICELCTGGVAALMPFVKDDTSAITVTFSANSENRLSLLVTPPNMCTSDIGMRVAVGIGSDIHSAVEEVFHRVHQSAALHGPSHSSLSQGNQCSSVADASILNSLGYCTWNTFYRDVSADATVATLKDISRASHNSKQPTPKWVMIDDGWQSVDSYDAFGKLYDIYANEKKFPGQFEHMVSELAEIGIKQVGVWHALWGYWGGIDPNGPLAARYSVQKYRRKASPVVDEESDVWLISSKDIGQFYDEFYKWLSSQGISLVKVDYQSAFETLEEYTTAPDGRDGDSAVAELYSSYYNAMESAARKYFGAGRVIYCMSHSPQLITRVLRQYCCRCLEGGKQLPPTSQRGPFDAKERMPFRNSNDYYPDIAESHGFHIYCNMANSIWSQMLGGYFVADWDMFKPGKREGRMHSVSRVVSGGPVYVTGDKDDFTAQDLSEIAGSSSQILQCNVPLIDNNCAFTDSTQSPSLLLSSSASPRNASVLVYMCNVSTSTVVSPVDISQLYRYAKRHSSPDSDTQSSRSSSTFYAVHQYSTGRVLVTTDLESVFAIALQPLTGDILTVAPMSVFQSANRSALLYATCIGDTTRYGGANVVERDVSSVLPDYPHRQEAAAHLSSSHRFTGLLHCFPVYIQKQVSGSLLSCISDGAEVAERYSWNIRAKVALPSSKVAFVFRARSTGSRPKDLSISVSNVRASGIDIDKDNWKFDSSTNTLSVAILSQIDSQGDEPFTRITVTLSCSCAKNRIFF